VPDELENRVESLESRVSGLEQRLHVSEQDAAAARVLAGGADRDVAEIRTEIREFRDQNTRLHTATRQDFADMRTRFDRLAAGQEQIVGMLNTLIDRDSDA
jgi:chromosome segregation ATPase